MKLLSTIVLSFLPLLAFTQSYSNPESIAFDATNNRYLVSNSNNGQIIARAADGTLSVFKSGISPQPYGIEVVDGVVYANCGGFVKGYSLNDGSQVFSVNTGASFLNGIASDGNGNLFVTDFQLKKIHRINIASQSSNVMASGLGQSPNGMIYEAGNNRLVFVNWGSSAPIKAMSMVDSTVTVLASTSYSNCDGIAKDNQGNYYVSSWGTSGIIKYSPDFSSSEVILTGLTQPADIFFNELSDTLAIPVTGANSVIFIGVGAPIVSPCSELPFTIDEESISFEYVNPAFGDSILTFNITNGSDLGFAYPLAQIIPSEPLPSGMTFEDGDDTFVVFASAWNPAETLPVTFHFSVNEEIPENTLMNFTLRVFNLEPSTIDTCFFETEFSVNLRPAGPLRINKLNTDEITVFPNPSNGHFKLQNVQNNSYLKIMDLSGRIIQETMSSLSNEFDLQPGIYLLNIESKSSIITKRIVIQ
jgi:hypothetical protein